jgi:DNA-binding response OmpR family regulator
MSPAEVTARVAAVLRRSPKKHDDVFDDGIVQMHAANASVVVHGEQIALTPLELRLLGALTEHPGRVVTPEQLGHLVWGRLSPSTADNARLYVSYLRAKIERDPSNPQLIETVRGRGYRYTGMALGSAAPGGASLTLPAFTESAPTAARARAGV